MVAAASTRNARPLTIELRPPTRLPPRCVAARAAACPAAPRFVAPGASLAGPSCDRATCRAAVMLLLRTPKSPDDEGELRLDERCELGSL